MSNRIDVKLAETRAAGAPAIAPFLTVGFPDVETSARIGTAALEAGADLLELGIPFSDPLAEGPTIQKSSFHALRQGVNFGVCLQAMRQIRRRNDNAPLLFMGYYNPLLRYGLESAAADAAEAGCDGLIVADLPVEESGPLAEQCVRRGLHLVPMLAPTSADERISQACEHAGGFIYCVSVAGVTGARDSVHGNVRDLVARIRRHTSLPVLVGFGISRPEHVAEVAAFADGVAVGSALIDTIESAGKDEAVEAVSEFVAGLRAEVPRRTPKAPKGGISL